MGGALSRSLARGWAGGGRARRYASGGDVDDIEDSASSLPLPPIPPPGGGAPAPQGALASANPANASPPPQGALNQRMAPGGGGSPDQQDPDAQRKMFDLDRAMSVLRASSGVNPMIAAAGAMLAPTRTGGFSESLGNAFTAYAHGAETERSQDEQAAQRLLQAQWQNDYRQQMASAATSRAASYGTSVDNRGDLQDAQTQVALAKVPLEQAQAAKITSQAALAGAENGRFVYSGNNPDGLPVFYDTRNPSRMVVGDVPLAPKTTDQLKLDQGQQKIDLEAGKFQQTQEFHDGVQALKQAGVQFNQALAVGTLASKIMAAKPGTTWPQAFDQAKQGLPGVGGQPAAPARGAAAPAQSQPAATPAPAAATPAQRPPPPSAYPNAQWSDKYGTYLVPGSAPGKWTNVGVGQASQ